MAQRVKALAATRPASKTFCQQRVTVIRPAYQAFLRLRDSRAALVTAPMSGSVDRMPPTRGGMVVEKTGAAIGLEGRQRVE